MNIKGKIVLLLDTVIHAVLLSGALVLAYNSYKELVRGTNNMYFFPLEVKLAIKSAFQWEVLIFVILYLLYGMLTSPKGRHAAVNKYFVTIVLYVIFANLFLYSRGLDVVIVLNFAVLYFVLFLLLYAGLKLLVAVILLQAPPSISIFLKGSVAKAKGYALGRESEPFIVGFIILFSLCALLLIFSQERIGEELANIAYVLLVIGVVKEVLKMARCGKKDEQG